MNIIQIDKFLVVLKKFEAVSGVKTLYYDVEQVYRPMVASQSLPEEYIVVWDFSIITRLYALRHGFPNFNEPTAWVPKPLGAAMPRILFGQLRIKHEFQASLTGNQQAIVGFSYEKIVARPLKVVANMLGSKNDSEIGLDDIPVQIFYVPKNKCWVAANNRGYAVHCLANVSPLRVWPLPPHAVELNRLEEMESAPKFTYESTVIKRLDKKPHSLPSSQIPITAGPNSWVVSEVAEVPNVQA